MNRVRAVARAAVVKLLARKSASQRRYVEPRLALRWLDLLRGDTLWNIGVSLGLGEFWPLFNPHPLHGIPYSDRHWCQSVPTMHKTASADMREL